jgi:hypothetical protein
MNRVFRSILYLLIFFAVVAAGYILLRSRENTPAAPPAAWTVVDESYVPRGPVEEFIKADAERQGALPIEIRNHGRDSKVLSRFRGKQFARPTENVLALFFKNLDDWTVVEIRYKSESGLEALRTVLYVHENSQWKVGDSGTLIE